MGPLRVPIHLYKGPYDKQVVTVTRMLEYLLIPNGDTLRIDVYVKLGEMEYAYSEYQSSEFSRDEQGRAGFLQSCILIPNHGLEWTEEKHSQ